MRKLQISLPDFRRLCIFKGIYPREPRNKRKAAKNSTPNTTFYYTKDIQYLLHEPLLDRFRLHHALAKKVSRALAKGRPQDAARLERNLAPRLPLDHIIKERYPTFVDALRDLDDCLSMLFLFASLPSHHDAVPPRTIALCQRLCLEFQHFLIVTHSLRKSFLSIKGIYYQATIQGQDILWLVPYNFVQRVTNDVDFRIMGTFVEFYTTLLGFVNFRLYSTAGLVYPPKFDSATDEGAAGLDAVTPQLKDVSASAPPKQIQDSATAAAASGEANKRAQAIANALESKTSNPRSNPPSDDESDDEDFQDAPSHQPSPAFQKQDPLADDAPQLGPSSDAQAAASSALFANMVVYLARETPRAPLEFLLKAFGCTRVGWPEILGSGAFTSDESDQRITHQIVDRPLAPVSNGGTDGDGNGDGKVVAGTQRFPGRVYVQPQWVWDSANALALQRTDLYAPGATLPPHLSPFVKARAGQYDPTVPLEDMDGGDAARDIEAAARVLANDDEDADMNVDEMDDDEEDEDEDEEEEGSIAADVDDIKALADMDASVPSAGTEDSASASDFGGFSADENEVSSASDAESAPAPPVKKAPKPKQTAKEAAAAEKAAWELERRKMMLPRKKRALYERVAYSRAERDAKTEKLKARRRKIEGGG